MNYQNIVKKISSAFPVYRDNHLPLHEPLFNGSEWQYVKDCLDTGWVSSVGKYVDRFERDLEKYTGIKHAIVTMNGTSALHLCFMLAGVLPGDEVLTPTLSFVATANAIHYCGAIPHFIDTESKHLGIDIQKLSDYLKKNSIIKNNSCYNRQTGRPIRAICVMHTFGHPVDLDHLLPLAEQYRLTLIEDAAEALGSFYRDKHVGNHGLLCALSFNGNKIITTGGGGAVLTNNTELARKAKHMSTTAKKPHPWEYYHDMTGYNYRMPNINAALGCAQLEQLPGFLKIKRDLFEIYQQHFSEVDGVRLLTEPENARSNYWLNALVLEKSYALHREEILEELNKIGVGARPIWTLMHQLPMYKNSPRMDLTVAEDMVNRVVNIPSSVGLGEVIARQN